VRKSSERTDAELIREAESHAAGWSQVSTHSTARSAHRDNETRRLRGFLSSGRPDLNRGPQVPRLLTACPTYPGQPRRALGYRDRVDSVGERYPDHSPQSPDSLDRFSTVARIRPAPSRSPPPPSRNPSRFPKESAVSPLASGQRGAPPQTRGIPRSSACRVSAVVRRSQAAETRRTPTKRGAAPSPPRRRTSARPRASQRSRRLRVRATLGRIGRSVSTGQSVTGSDRATLHARFPALPVPRSSQLPIHRPESHRPESPSVPHCKRFPKTTARWPSISTSETMARQP
jgi:hypothetical protein